MMNRHGAPYGALACERRSEALGVQQRVRHSCRTIRWLERRAERGQATYSYKFLRPAALIAVLWTSTACQSYTPQPLELSSRMDIVRARVDDDDAHRGFVDRLTLVGVQVPTEFDLADGASLAEGEVLALFYNAELRVMRLRAGVALARYETSGLWQDPQFGFDAAQVLSPGNHLEYGGVLSLTLPVSGRLAVERAKASAEYRVELARIVDNEWRTRAAVRKWWYSWSAAERRRVLLEDAVEQIRAIGVVAARLEAAGAIRKADERLLRLELVGRQAELQATELEVQQARVALLSTMGLAPDAAIQLNPSSAAAIGPASTDVEERIERCNTQLALLRAEYEVAEDALRLAIRRQYPDVGIGAGYGSEDSDNRFLFGLSLPLPLLNRNRQEIAEAWARRNVSRAEAETAVERIVREVGLAELALDAATRQRIWLEQELEPLLLEQMENITELMSLGEVDAFLLLETIGRQLDARTRLVDLELIEAETLVQLTTLLGPDRDSATPTPADELPVAQGGDNRAGEPVDEEQR